MKLFSRKSDDGREVVCSLSDGNVQFTVDGVEISRQSMMDIDSVDSLRGEAWAAGLVKALDKRGATAVWNGQVCLYGNEAEVIKAAKAAYQSRPEVRLPHDREDLRCALSSAYDNFDRLRDQDFDKDIGFLSSPAAEKEIEDAKQALADFDAAHPEIAAKVAKEYSDRMANNLKSVLNQ